MSENKAHSEDFFGEWRDYWWNKDFVELMAKRWNLSQVNSMLDVGCGIGHWSRVLFPYLSNTVRIYGTDMEAASIEKANSIAARSSVSNRCYYSVSFAENLPFQDNSFDLVTCQTLLIHVKDANKVLCEMKRVLKPGGLLIAAEPNNAAQNLMETSLSFEDPIELKLKRIEFALLCEKGKFKVGHGYNSIGELLPGLFADIGLSNINVFMSDKSSPYVPPYETIEQKINVKQVEEWSENEIFMWNKEESLKYYLAGGGKQESFDEYWNLTRENSVRFKNGLLQKKLYTAGGVVFYLISGVKN
jgi:SAM-dependent methyltransferase